MLIRKKNHFNTKEEVTRLGHTNIKSPVCQRAKEKGLNLLIKISQRWQRLIILNINRGHSVKTKQNKTLNLNREIAKF